MGTVIICTLAGGGIGATIAVVLYILGFGVELVNCACQIVTCNCDGGDAIPGMWSSGSFTSVLIFCIIGGAVIGFIYGLFSVKAERDAEARKRDEENSEAARKQREQWANEVKQNAISVSNTCAENSKNVVPLVHTSYKANSELDDVLNELASVSELIGKVDSMAEDTKKGGASK